MSKIYFSPLNLLFEPIPGSRSKYSDNNQLPETIYFQTVLDSFYVLYNFPDQVVVDFFISFIYSVMCERVKKIIAHECCQNGCNPLH